MPIGSDFEIQGDGDIRHISGASTYTVLELHRWLQDLADDAQASGDDFMDITVGTPSERSTNNIITLNSPFNIDETAAQYLYDGSVTQLGGDEIYAGLVCVGAVEAGTQLQITQDEVVLTSFWADGLNEDASANILNRILVKVRENGADIDGRRIIVWARELSDTYAEFSVTMGLGNNVAAIFTANDLNNQTAEGTIAGWSSIVNTEGYQLLDIAGDGSANEPYYSRWDKGPQSSKDLYERTKWIARRGSTEAIHSTTGPLFRGITHEFNYDGEVGSMSEDAILAWGTSFAYDGGTGTAPAAGQYWENTTSGGVGKVVFATGAATGTVVIQRETTAESWDDNDVYTLLGGTGTITQAGAVTGAANAGGAGRLLALKDDGATGTCWVQVVSGTAPADNYELWQRGQATKRADVSGAATARTVKPEFLGAYTGSSIIGAFGVGIDPADGIAADSFTTLANAVVSPPNNQKFIVFGLISGEDRVLVANNSGGLPDFDQLALNTTLSGAAETAVVVATAIPADTPSTGVLRIQLDTGVYRRVAYTGWTGSTFAIGETDFTGSNQATAPRNVFVAYIDKLASGGSPGDTVQEEVTLKYAADRTMFVRVRDGGATPIKTFESTATFSTGGGSATAIRTADA